MRVAMYVSSVVGVTTFRVIPACPVRCTSLALFGWHARTHARTHVCMHTRTDRQKHTRAAVGTNARIQRTEDGMTRMSVAEWPRHSPCGPVFLTMVLPVRKKLANENRRCGFTCSLGWGVVGWFDRRVREVGRCGWFGRRRQFAPHHAAPNRPHCASPHRAALHRTTHTQIHASSERNKRTWYRILMRSAGAMTVLAVAPARAPESMAFIAASALWTT